MSDTNTGEEESAAEGQQAGALFRPGRGWFGIGVEGVSKSANLGALFRTAHAFGASFIFTAAAAYSTRAGREADTSDAPRHVPFYRFEDAASMSLPRGCTLVGVELAPEAVALPSFRHPLNAAYVLGPERASLSPAMLARCAHVVRIPTRFAINLAVAGALVMYDRMLVHGRFPDRPVRAGGPAPEDRAAGAHVHGRPKFRRGVPPLLRKPGEGGTR